MSATRIGACMAVTVASMLGLLSGGTADPATAPAAAAATRPAGGELWILSGQSNACAKRPGKFAPPVTDRWSPATSAIRNPATHLPRLTG